MRKLRLIFPVAQLTIAAILLEQGYWAYLPRGSDTFSIPTGRLVCDGINAPVLLLMNGLKYLLDRLSVLTSRTEIVLYFVCIALLWYLVGREIDRWNQERAMTHRRATTARVGFNIFLEFWGILMIIYSAMHFGNLRSFIINNPGYLIEGPLCWAWALILIFYPTWSLLNAIRASGRGPHIPTPSTR